MDPLLSVALTEFGIRVVLNLLLTLLDAGIGAEKPVLDHLELAAEQRCATVVAAEAGTRRMVVVVTVRAGVASRRDLLLTRLAHLNNRQEPITQQARSFAHTSRTSEQ